jgi:hypothetical protein
MVSASRRPKTCTNSEVELADADFRFTPESGLKSDIPACPFRAINGLMHRSKLYLYSIT